MDIVPAVKRDWLDVGSINEFRQTTAPIGFN